MGGLTKIEQRLMNKPFEAGERVTFELNAIYQRDDMGTSDTRDDTYAGTTLANPNIVEATILAIPSNFTIKALLITFPVNITQDIWSAAAPAYQVKNLNVSFPAASGDQWVDLSDETRIKILLRDDQDPYFPAGTYEFEFPVALPHQDSYPKQYENIWAISVCDSVLCNEPDGYGTLVTFVQFGFTLFGNLRREVISVATRLGIALCVLFVLS